MVVYEPLSPSTFRFRGHFIDAGLLQHEAQSGVDSSGATIHERCQSANSLVIWARDLFNDHRGQPQGYSAHEVWTPEKRRQVIRSVAYSLWKLRHLGMQLPDACLIPCAPSPYVEASEFSEEGW